MSDTTRRPVPEWKRLPAEHITDQQLAKMRAEAAEIDAHNAEALKAVVAAFEAYTASYRAYFGVIPENIKRNGRRYLATPITYHSTAAQVVAEVERSVATARERAAEKKRAADQAARQAAEKRKADLDLARLILRYDLPEDSDWNDALYALRQRSQYLDLALAGQETRCDWSDGFYRVSDALGRFRINDERDKEIVADITGCMGSDDGRVFRDTAWSYDALFELVEDKQLVTDARLCLERAGAARW